MLKMESDNNHGINMCEINSYGFAKINILKNNCLNL